MFARHFRRAGETKSGLDMTCREAGSSDHSCIGMGLTICKKIVEMNGGVIDVFSEGELQGTTFMFTMKMFLPKSMPGDVSILDQH